jgi:hypothetical protein
VATVVDEAGMRRTVGSSTRAGGWDAGRRWRRELDQVLVDEVASSGQVVVEVDGGRLGWWARRRRLRRAHGS